MQFNKDEVCKLYTLLEITLSKAMYVLLHSHYWCLKFDSPVTLFKLFLSYLSCSMFLLHMVDLLSTSFNRV